MSGPFARILTVRGITGLKYQKEKITKRDWKGKRVERVAIKSEVSRLLIRFNDSTTTTRDFQEKGEKKINTTISLSQSTFRQKERKKKKKRKKK